MASQGSPQADSQFLGLFTEIAKGNPQNDVATYGKAHALGAAIATRHAHRAAEIIGLMEHVQESSIAVEMAQLMLTLRDERDVNPKDGDNVAEVLHQLNPSNGGATYGTAFMVGLQAAIVDKAWGKQVAKAWEQAGGRASRELEEQTYEVVKRDRRAFDLESGRTTEAGRE